jgi:hypothetical protein
MRGGNGGFFFCGRIPVCEDGKYSMASSDMGEGCEAKRVKYRRLQSAWKAIGLPSKITSVVGPLIVASGVPGFAFAEMGCISVAIGGGFRSGRADAMCNGGTGIGAALPRMGWLGIIACGG